MIFYNPKYIRTLGSAMSIKAIPLSTGGVIHPLELCFRTIIKPMSNTAILNSINNVDIKCDI